MSGMPSSAGWNPALRSAPDENPRPAPVTTTARTDSCAASCSITCLSSRPNSAVHALRVWGRLSVNRPTAPVCSQMIVS